MANKNYEWITLGYTVPANPSKNRVYVWRKLKECGAEYWRQGVAVLPNTPQNLQQFAVLSTKIRSLGGEAAMAEMRFFDLCDTDKMVEKFKQQAENEYSQLMQDCRKVLQSLRLMSSPSSRQLHSDIKQMEKRYRKVKTRSFLPEELAQELEKGFYEVKSTFQETMKEFSVQLQDMRDFSGDACTEK